LLFLCFLTLLPPPASTLFPYTTLFRSVPRVGLACLQARHARCEKRLAPLGQLRRRDLRLPRHRVQVLAAQQPQHRITLGLRRPAAALLHQLDLLVLHLGLSSWG